MTQVINESTDSTDRPDVTDESTDSTGRSGVTRRNVLRAGAVGIAAVVLGAGKVIMQPSLARRGLLNPDGVFGRRRRR